MNLKQRLKEKALEMGFEGVGVTHAEPLDLYIKEIESRPEKMYNWVRTDAFNVRRGADFKKKYPWAKSMIVLIRNYHRRAFPKTMVGYIGRCYQVDERIEHGREHRRIMDYFSFLKAEGVGFRFDEEIPARMSAARAGVTTYGRNCFAYARDGMRGASWLESIPIVLDADLEPDDPSIEVGCPDWCKDACIAACPTGALYAPKKMNPRLCIAYNSYYAADRITPMALREPMGTWVYGCDRCQEVCPRNQPWMNQDLPENPALEARARDFEPAVLVDMTEAHYQEKVWPFAFYMAKEKISNWQMNAARALGNMEDRGNVKPLVTALNNSPHEKVRGMSAWSLGRLGGHKAKKALESKRDMETETVKAEIASALEKS